MYQCTAESIAQALNSKLPFEVGLRSLEVRRSLLPFWRLRLGLPQLFNGSCHGYKLITSLLCVKQNLIFILVMVVSVAVVVLVNVVAEFVVSSHCCGGEDSGDLCVQWP